MLLAAAYQGNRCQKSSSERTERSKVKEARDNSPELPLADLSKVKVQVNFPNYLQHSRP